MSLKNRLLHILPNVRQMLIHRGYKSKNIIDTSPSPHLIYKIDQFLSLTIEDNYKSFLDIFVHNSEKKDLKKDFVRFLKNEKSINKIFEREMNDIMTIYGLTSNDNITFIMLEDEFSKEDQLKLNIIESNFPMLRIFSYKNFIIDIGSHVLVPKHTKFIGDPVILKKNLMIDSLDKLPVILHTDPMSKLLNLRNDDIVEVTRNSVSRGLRTFRVCKDENFTPVRKKIKALKSKKVKTSAETEGVAAKVDSKPPKIKSKKKKIIFKGKKKKSKPPLTNMTSPELDEEVEKEATEKLPDEKKEDSSQIFWDNSKNIQFYSKSSPLKEPLMKIVSLRYLSNFHRIIGNSIGDDEALLGPITNIDIESFGGFTIDGKEYSTIEHYFQSKKYNGEYHMDLTRANKAILKSIRVKFIKDGEFDNPSNKIFSKYKIKPSAWGLMAQSADRALRKKFPDLKFNSSKWNIERKGIMKEALEARYAQDIKFKETLRELRRRNKVLFHFERKGTYWGGSRPLKLDPEKRIWVGENVLGELIMDLE